MRLPYLTKLTSRPPATLLPPPCVSYLICQVGFEISRFTEFDENRRKKKKEKRKKPEREMTAKKSEVDED